MRKQDQAPCCPVQAVVLVNIFHSSCNPMSEVLITPGEAKRAVVPLLTWKPGILNCFWDCIIPFLPTLTVLQCRCAASHRTAVGRQYGRVENARGRRLGSLGSSPLLLLHPRRAGSPYARCCTWFFNCPCPCFSSC